MMWMMGVSEKKRRRSTTWYQCWYRLKLGTSERKIQGCPFIVAASGVNESEVVSVNKDSTPFSVIMSN